MPRPRRARHAQNTTKTTKTTNPQPADTSDIEMHTARRGRTRAARSSAAGFSTSEQSSILAANRSRDAALDRLAGEDVTTSGNTMEDDDLESHPETGRRELETPLHRRDTTGLDLADDSMFGDLDDSFEDGVMPRPPGSADSTSLSISSFRPRSRQSSIIGRNDPPIRPSSRSGTTPGVSSSFNIGLFKRRAREPSILGTSRKARHDTTTTTAATQDSELESEDDFAPEAVSTPVNNRRRTRQSLDANEPAGTTELNESVTRKRRSEEARHESEPPEKASRTKEQHAASDDGSDSELSSLPSPQQPPPAMFPRPVTPNNDDIIAPPASSASESDGEGDDAWPDIHALAKRRRRPSVTTPLRADNASDISSPPSLTHSPNYAEARDGKAARGRSGTRPQASPRFTTADLANMLPKRRYKKNRENDNHADNEELDNSGLGHDDDELSHLDARASRRRGAAGRAGANETTALKAKQAAGSSRSGLRSRTQARRLSDKENESQTEDEDENEEEPSRFVPMPDDSFGGDTGETREFVPTEELQNASRKFMEVDQWELSYEEVAPTSSPQGAR